jgi:hypothetical protein
MEIIGHDMPVVFPMHPKSRRKLPASDLAKNHPGVMFIDPLG